jgi:hypothetical protein
MSNRKPSKRGAGQARKSTAKKPAARKSTAKSGAKRKPAARKSTASKPRAVAAAPVVPLLADTEAGPSLTSDVDTEWSFRNMVKGVDVRDRKTQIALASAALVVVLIAVVAAWPSSSSKNAELAAGDAQTETIDDVTDEAAPEAETNDPVKKATSNAPNTNQTVDPAVENPFQDRAQAQKIGAMIRPQSTSLPNGNPNTWTGVTKDSIKFAIAYDKSNCGVNTLTLAQQTTANLPTKDRYYREQVKNQETGNKEFEEAARVLVEVVNKRGLEGAEDFPHIRKLMGNDPTHPYFGRRINLQIVDGGSYQCPNTTTAAAIKIIEDIKPFVVIQDDGLSRSAYNMAAALNAKAPPTKRPMHFGTLSESDALYKKWSPFVWTQFASGTSQVRQYASWLCAKVHGKNAVQSAQYKGAKRKIALMYPNFQQVRIIANELKNFAKSYCGVNPFATEFAYDTDPSRAADLGSSIAIRFRTEGITSVAYLLDLFAPLFHIIAMKSQDYRPEFVFTPTNYMDSSTVQRIYEQDMVDRASFGITTLGVPGGFGVGAGDPFFAYHDLHKKSPKTGKACDPSSDAGMDHDPTYCKAPRAIITLYYSVLPLLGGIVFAGPDLNPTNVTNGLQAYPRTRFGGAGPTTDPRPALVGAGKGKHYFLVDATEWRWRAGYVSPPPEKKLGWVEWSDCQRHYYLWPDKLALYWEKGGENYNAWCGNAKYVDSPYRPKDLNGDGDYEDDLESCADTPSGKCETDGYPPHPPEGKRPS